MASTSCCSRGAAGLGPALRLAPQTNLNLMITHYNYFRDMSKWFYVLIADRKFGVQFLRIPYTHKNKSRALCVKKTPFFMGGDHRTHTNNLCGDLCILLTYIHQIDIDIFYNAFFRAKLLHILLVLLNNKFYLTRCALFISIISMNFNIQMDHANT